VRHTKIWETKNWKRLLENIKKGLKNFKIVQVDINSDYLEETDLDLNGKTSFDELCSVIKYSSLHIDTDGSCIHIAEALNVKYVILFGLSNFKNVGYDNNINVASGLCSDCFTIIEEMIMTVSWNGETEVVAAFTVKTLNSGDITITISSGGG
jgi:ADP-heptose:LPS heptosyltransferase